MPAHCSFGKTYSTQIHSLHLQRSRAAARTRITQAYMSCCTHQNNTDIHPHTYSHMHICMYKSSTAAFTIGIHQHTFTSTHSQAKHCCMSQAHSRHKPTSKNTHTQVKHCCMIQADTHQHTFMNTQSKVKHCCMSQLTHNYIYAFTGQALLHEPGRHEAAASARRTAKAAAGVFCAAQTCQVIW